MKAVIDILIIALNLYWWVIIISAVLSWLIAFNVVNYRNQIVAQIDTTLRALTEPVLAPIRRRMPNLGAVDISPIVLLLGIIFIQMVLSYYVRPYVF
ncbi:YggT family protein [Phreatobacter oligotrophus]|jgi:YggT family protein|uniref:YggT family protein n=1 Tax=Phreatobacter oligotrophus TaxID=1122261 RepID=A0A2T4ZEJ3_9HYPH|nr:YggT family protein [Phreatobacter oligotrophus]MBX9991066.1 YggT family protein [Phreatobacter oligotrophus]PTM60311.1 YggT family protein [Phreatobacter oligotrophus]